MAFLQRTHSSPTCFTFPAPIPSYGHAASQPPVLAALYTGASSGEPGMILISTTGHVRFWETMSLALANVERYQSMKLELGDDDLAQRIFKIDVSALTCTWWREFILSISRAHLSSRPLPP